MPFSYAIALIEKGAALIQSSGDLRFKISVIAKLHMKFTRLSFRVLVLHAKW